MLTNTSVALSTGPSSSDSLHLRASSSSSDPSGTAYEAGSSSSSSSSTSADPHASDESKPVETTPGTPGGEASTATYEEARAANNQAEIEAAEMRIVEMIEAEQAVVRRNQRYYRLAEIPLTYKKMDGGKYEFFSPLRPSLLEDIIPNHEYALRMYKLNDELSKLKPIYDTSRTYRTYFYSIALTAVILALIARLYVPVDALQWSLAGLGIFAVIFGTVLGRFRPHIIGGIHDAIQVWNVEDAQQRLHWFTETYEIGFSPTLVPVPIYLLLVVEQREAPLRLPWFQDGQANVDQLPSYQPPAEDGNGEIEMGSLRRRTPPPSFVATAVTATPAETAVTERASTPPQAGPVFPSPPAYRSGGAVQAV
ncbi:hypothetical protein DFJ73DRAFT_855977 [Zopfochytrium polystomum]|nr:hypothetical protein DFJ73DRAFT_855977 [Zopfochytrium polystomum]